MKKHVTPFFVAIMSMAFTMTSCSNSSTPDTSKTIAPPSTDTPATVVINDVMEYRGKRIKPFDSASYQRLLKYVRRNDIHPPYEMEMPVAQYFLPRTMSGGERMSNFSNATGTLYLLVATVYADSTSSIVSYCYRGGQQTKDPAQFYPLRIRPDGIYTDGASKVDSTVESDIKGLVVSN